MTYPWEEPEAAGHGQDRGKTGLGQASGEGWVKTVIFTLFAHIVVHIFLIILLYSLMLREKGEQKVREKGGHFLDFAVELAFGRGVPVLF